MKNKKHRILLAISSFVSFVMISPSPRTVLSENLSSTMKGSNNKFSDQIFQINKDLENAMSKSNTFSGTKRDRIQSLLQQRAGILSQIVGAR